MFWLPCGLLLTGASDRRPSIVVPRLFLWWWRLQAVAQRLHAGLGEVLGLLQVQSVAPPKFGSFAVSTAVMFLTINALLYIHAYHIHRF
jgi:hypothetical protein